VISQLVVMFNYPDPYSVRLRFRVRVRINVLIRVTFQRICLLGGYFGYQHLHHSGLTLHNMTRVRVMAGFRVRVRF
jgi:hypothetical protein